MAALPPGTSRSFEMMAPVLGLKVSSRAPVPTAVHWLADAQVTE
jgi:hypothetical protein